MSSRLEKTLVDHHADGAGLRVNVTSQLEAHDGDNGRFALHFAVVREDGKLGLERSYRLGLADCKSVAKLLALALDRFLTTFPEWAEPPRRKPRPAAATRWLELELLVATSAHFSPAGAEAEVGMLAHYGGRGQHRLAASALVRAALPGDLGEGRFQSTAAMLGAGWLYRQGAWRSRLEVRAGTVLVSGMGFGKNGRAWLPWIEAVGTVERRWSWIGAGLVLAASPQRHRAVTSDRLSSEPIARLRIGAVVTIPFFGPLF